LGLSEEVGELVKEIMELEIYNTPRLPLSDEAKASLSDEIGDILFSLLEVCSAYEIELETAYEGKFAKIRDKRADWIARFGQQLQARRFQLDQ
jgi:NTP pyrophosphatase (non-canonical NTP hydrolase)